MNEPWFDEMLNDIRQPKGRAVNVDHKHGEELPSIPPPPAAG